MGKYTSHHLFSYIGFGHVLVFFLGLTLRGRYIVLVSSTLGPLFIQPKFQNGRKMVRKRSGESFQKIRKSLNSQKANHSTQGLGNSEKSNGTEVRGKKLRKFSVHFARLSSSQEILGNALTFVTEKFPGIFHRMEELLLIIYFLVFTKVTVKITKLPQPEP